MTNCFLVFIFGLLTTQTAKSMSMQFMNGPGLFQSHQRWPPAEQWDPVQQWNPVQQWDPPQQWDPAQQWGAAQQWGPTQQWGPVQQWGVQQMPLLPEWSTQRQSPWEPPSPSVGSSGWLSNFFNSLSDMLSPVFTEVEKLNKEVFTQGVTTISSSGGNINCGDVSIRNGDVYVEGKLMYNVKPGSKLDFDDKKGNHYVIEQQLDGATSLKITSSSGIGTTNKEFVEGIATASIINEDNGKVSRKPSGVKTNVYNNQGTTAGGVQIQGLNGGTISLADDTKFDVSVQGHSGGVLNSFTNKASPPKPTQIERQTSNQKLLTPDENMGIGSGETHYYGPASLDKNQGKPIRGNSDRFANKGSTLAPSGGVTYEVIGNGVEKKKISDNIYTQGESVFIDGKPFALKPGSPIERVDEKGCRVLLERGKDGVLKTTKSCNPELATGSTFINNWNNS